MAPVMLIWLSWYVVVLTVIIANLLWSLFVRYRVLNVRAGYIGVIIVRLKWISWPVATIYLFHKGRTPESWIALA